MRSNSPIRTKRLGAWSVEEDVRLITYMQNRDRVYWSDVPEAAGLVRSSNSCRTRWLQHLSPDIEHHNFTLEEENYMVKLYRAGYDRWTDIARRLPGGKRTANEVKYHWRTVVIRKLLNQNINPITLSTNNESVSSNHLNEVTVEELNLELSLRPPGRTQD